jgi:hypothetical protein
MIKKIKNKNRMVLEWRERIGLVGPAPIIKILFKRKYYLKGKTGGGNALNITHAGRGS